MRKLASIAMVVLLSFCATQPPAEPVPLSDACPTDPGYSKVDLETPQSPAEVSRAVLKAFVANDVEPTNITPQLIESTIPFETDGFGSARSRTLRVLLIATDSGTAVHFTATEITRRSGSQSEALLGSTNSGRGRNLWCRMLAIAAATGDAVGATKRTLH